MMRKLLPVLLLLMGTGAGIAAGRFLGPQPDPSAHAAAEEKTAKADAHEQETEFVKLNNQFVVPVVHNERVESLVVMSLSVETSYGTREQVYAREPKLRDLFLRVLFDHANLGGFDGAFTRPDTLGVLRDALADTAKLELGEIVQGVLITDIARQDN